MPLVLRDITEIEVFPSRSFRGLNARVRIWRLNTGLAHTEDDISFMNVTYLQVYEEHTRAQYIGCLGAGKHLLRTCKQNRGTEVARSNNMETSCLDKDLYAQTDLSEGVHSVCRIA